MPRKSNRLAQRFNNLGRKNLAILAAFALVFVGFGSLFVYRSEAAWSCAQHVYYQGEAGIYHGYCVYQIQHFINDFHDSYLGSISGVPRISADGVYGPATAGAVAKYQQFVGTKAFIYGQLKSQGALPLYADGKIGRNTWFAIRDTLNNGAVAGDYYSTMGLGVSTTTYGKYYVNGTRVY